MFAYLLYNVLHAMSVSTLILISSMENIYKTRVDEEKKTFR